jgi:hypothetical protein
MRQIILAVAVSLALTPAVPVFAAEKCHDETGKVIACPKPDKSDKAEVEVAAPPPRNLPNDTTGDPMKKGPAYTIPPMSVAQCRDGTYARNTLSQVACDAHGGVAMWAH